VKSLDGPEITLGLMTSPLGVIPRGSMGSLNIEFSLASTGVP